MKIYLKPGTTVLEASAWNRNGNFVTATLKGGIVDAPATGTEFTISVKDDLGGVVQPDLVVTVQGYNVRAQDTNGVVNYLQNDLVFQVKGGAI